MAHKLAIPPKAPSPFFAGSTLQFAWDQTSLGLLMECPRKYQLSILEQWSSKGKSHHLTFGGRFADAMQHYHLARAGGKDHEEALDIVVAQALRDTWIRPLCEDEGCDQFGKPHVHTDTGEPWDSGDTKKNRMTLIRSIIWYFETYRDDAMRTVILPNGEPAVELLFTFESGIKASNNLGEFLFTGHIDRLVDFDGTKFVLDNKTTGGGLGTYYFSQYDLDNQMSQYTLAGRVCYNVPVKGVVIDAAQIMVGFTAFGRSITTRSQAQLDEWHGNAGSWLHLAERFADSGKYPMNLKSCNNYGGCAFRSVCGSDPAIRKNMLETHFEKRVWNPLDVR